MHLLLAVQQESPRDGCAPLWTPLPFGLRCFVRKSNLLPSFPSSIRSKNSMTETITRADSGPQHRFFPRHSTAPFLEGDGPPADVAEACVPASPPGGSRLVGRVSVGSLVGRYPLDRCSGGRGRPVCCRGWFPGVAWGAGSLSEGLGIPRMTDPGEECPLCVVADGRSR